MKITRRRFITGASALAASTAFTAPAIARQRALITQTMVLCTGQSNMLGQGDPAEYPTPVNPNRIWTWRIVDGWYKPASPVVQGACIGPAYPMADRLCTLRPSIFCVLTPAAQADTSAAEWADPNGWLLQRAVEQWNEAIANVKDGYRIVPGGIFHWQGENDTQGGASPTWQNWCASTKEFYFNFTDAIGVPRLPFVYVQLANRTFTGKPNWENLREEQRKLVSDPEMSAFTRMVSTDDLTISDVHPPTAFHLEIGKRAANRFNVLLPA